MKFIINGKIYDFDQEELDYIIIGKGTEGCCYRVRNYRDDFVMKIHHKKPEKKILDEETCKAIKDIKTNRFVLPNNLVYDEDGNYLGYTVDFIEYKRPKIRNLKIGKIVDEFYNLEKDVNLLSKNYVYIDDLNYYNTVFSNGIYVCDPGSFSLAEDEYQERFAKYYNRLRITEYELQEILFNIFRFTHREEKALTSLLLNNEEYLSDFINYLGYEREEVAKTYFKDIVNR